MRIVVRLTGLVRVWIPSRLRSDLGNLVQVISRRCLCFKPCEIEAIGNQWRNLTVIKWNNLTSRVNFWIEVKNSTDCWCEAL